MNEAIDSQVRSFFSGLGIVIEDITITHTDTDLHVRLQTPDSALLIGMHGKSLEAFQHILSRIVESTVAGHVHLHLEVNDYMKAKDERLFRFLDSKIEFVISTGKSSRVPNLTSYERKKAHSYISDKKIAWLSTHSDGEGSERAIVLDYSGEIQKVPIEIHSPKPTLSQTPQKSPDLISEDGVGI
jgi:predicted RNA-binding protein Jag